MFCPWDAPTFLFFSENIPVLFFYSHLPVMIIALLIGLLVFLKNKRSIVGGTLLLITVLFFGWNLFDLILWSTNDPRNVVFFWSLQVLFEALIFTASVYLTYVFVRRKDMPFKYKIVFSLLLLPLILLFSTQLNIAGVTLVDCVAIEGFIATYYTYLLEIISVLAIVGIGIRGYILASSDQDKKEGRAFTLGIVFFLMAFLWGNVIGSFTDNWVLAQAGLIGMPIFVGFLAYLIVKFKAFNVRVLGAQVLVYALGFLILSLLFVRTIGSIRIIVVFTLGMIAVLGYNLIRSVKREVKQRQRLEALTTQLAQANEKLQDLDKLKTEFLSLASHQLRSPLTAIKGYTSMLLEGSFGNVEPKQKEAIDRVFQSSTHLTKVVEDLLNVSKIEQGGMKYEMAPFDFEKISKELATDLSVTAKNKGLELSFVTDNSGPYTVNGDLEKIRQVVLNLIDNSIKYTEKGSITVTLRKNASTKTIRLAISDTGMGISPQTKEKLFQKFSRGEGGKTNTGGSGLGLYLAKQIAEAHGGRIIIESEGLGKGSTFIIELKAI